MLIFAGFPGVLTTQGGFIRLSNIGRRMKSISELVIGKQWDIVI